MFFDVSSKVSRSSTFLFTNITLKLLHFCLFGVFITCKMKEMLDTKNKQLLIMKFKCMDTVKRFWLFRIQQPFETVFQSISDHLPEKRRQKRDDRQLKKIPLAHIASTVDSCPTIIQLVAYLALKLTQYHRQILPLPTAQRKCTLNQNTVDPRYLDFGNLE